MWKSRIEAACLVIAKSNTAFHTISITKEKQQKEKQMTTDPNVENGDNNGGGTDWRDSSYPSC